MAMEDRRGGFDFCELPEGCIANVLSLTSPRDAGRLSSVSSTFRSAADSDAVWRRFLPPDYLSIIAGSPESSHLLSLSPKELYCSLCVNPILIDGGRKSFSLDIWSGKKCYMLSARDLVIIWADTPRYWRWNSSSDPQSRFPEVAALIGVCWLEIRGRINAGILSPATRYAAYLVFSSNGQSHGFEDQPVEVGVGLVGGETSTRDVFLHKDATQRQHYQIVRRSFRNFNIFNPTRAVGPHTPPTPRCEDNNGKYPKERRDKWWEIELGEFTTTHDGDGMEGELEMSIMEVKGGNWKGGLVIQGIEIRPKDQQ